MHRRPSALAQFEPRATGQMAAGTAEAAERAGRRLRVLDVEIAPTDVERTCSTMEGWIAAGRREYVCVTGAHGVVECRRDERVRCAHALAGLVVPDGMPIVFMARKLGYPETGRVYGPDLMRRMTAISAAKGYRQFYYGGPPGLADRLASELRARYPQLQVAGTMSPPFGIRSDDEDAREIDAIDATRPDIVWVGLSTPKQELWMAEHRARLRAPVLVGIGAAFDFLAGTKRQAPLWVQHSGFEWLYRLASEPRRLWRRYARVVPTFAALALWQLAVARTARDNP